MKNIRVLASLNLIGLLLQIVMAAIVQLKWINKTDVAEVSNLYPTLFTPAGITFSIWSVIYLSLLAMCIYHLVKAFTKEVDHEANVATSDMGSWFFFNQLFTAAWLYVFTHQWLGISEILILLQLFSLIVVHGRLGIQEPHHSLPNKIVTQAPLSIYLGWISIATIANTALYLNAKDWSGWDLDPAMWTVLMIGAALVLTLLMIFLRNNILFGVVVIWALAGIIFRQYQLQNLYPSIVKAAWIGIGFAVLAILVQLFRMFQYHPGSTHTFVRREWSADKMP